MENSALIKQYVASLDGAVAGLDPVVKDLIGDSFEDRINTAQDPLQQIAISNGYAYIVVSLCFAYLKSQGVDTQTHPIMKDLDRVKSYMQRAKLAEEGKEEVKVDTDVAKKFIKSVLGSGPSISQENFKGKHTKFEDEEKHTTQLDDKTTKELRTKLNDSGKKKKRAKDAKSKVVKK